MYIPISMKCIICTSPLSGQQKKFCSIKCKQTDINARHQNYACQQARGHDRKRRLIEIKGGCCKVCGYAKNLAALGFHHREPAQKDHELDVRKLSNSTWEWCLQEADKCDLMCGNCHMEHHHPGLEMGLPVGYDPTT